MKSAAIYARGAQASVASVKRQVARCTDYASGLGYSVCEDRVFVDDGVSGRRPPLQRTGFLALRKALSQGSVQALVVEDLSRLARSAGDLTCLLAELRAQGVEVIEVERSLSPLGPGTFSLP
jgi:DNA invertase Pin-like site-specific DNA recombinase